MIKQLIAGSSATLAALVFALPASAATVNLGGAADTVTGVQDTVSTGLGESADTNGAVHTNVNGSANAEVNGTGNMNADTNSSADAALHVNGGVGDDSVVSLTSRDQDVTSFSSTGAHVSDAAQVTTNEQLRSYAAGVISSDKNIQNVELGPDSIAVDYNTRVRLLGVIPMNETTHVVVKQDGSVTVKYPWYHFLVAGSRAHAQAELQASLKNTLSGTSGSFSAQTRAMVISQVHDFMSGEEASADMHGSMDAELHSSAASTSLDSALQASSSTSTL